MGQFSQSYPSSIAGVSASGIFADYTCNTPKTFSSQCSTNRNGTGGGGHHHPGHTDTGRAYPVVTILILTLALGIVVFVGLCYWKRRRSITRDAPILSVGDSPRSSVSLQPTG